MNLLKNAGFVLFLVIYIDIYIDIYLYIYIIIKMRKSSASEGGVHNLGCNPVIL